MEQQGTSGNETGGDKRGRCDGANSKDKEILLKKKAKIRWSDGVIEFLRCHGIKGTTR